MSGLPGIQVLRVLFPFGSVGNHSFNNETWNHVLPFENELGVTWHFMEVYSRWNESFFFFFFGDCPCFCFFVLNMCFIWISLSRLFLPVSLRTHVFQIVSVVGNHALSLTSISKTQVGRSEAGLFFPYLGPGSSFYLGNDVAITLLYILCVLKTEACWPRELRKKPFCSQLPYLHTLCFRFHWARIANKGCISVAISFLMLNMIKIWFWNLAW